MNKILKQFNQLSNNEQIYLLDILSNNNFVLLESIKLAKELYFDEIRAEDFNKLIEIDPSKTKKYLNWICKEYLKGRELNRLKDVIYQFDLKVNKGLIKNKDIYYYKNIEELEDIIEKSPDKSKVDIKKQIKKTEVNIVLDNDYYFIVEPLTWEASKIYGKGTKWCTAQEDSNEYWKGDVKDIKARIFYVRDKKLNIDNPEYKIAIHVPISCFDKNKTINYSQIPCTLWDAEDKSTSSNLQEVSKKFGINVNKIENIEYIDFNTKEGIKEWLDEMEIKYYTINKDLTVDVNEDVYISFKNLSEIPIQFGIINGGFYCSDNKLTSLKGCPERIKGNFHCDDNNLETLEYCPKECRNFYCFDNPNLTSLEGCPEIVNGNFYCFSNPKLTKEYLDNFDFSFVKGNLETNYNDINDKWNNR